MADANTPTVIDVQAGVETQTGTMERDGVQFFWNGFSNSFRTEVISLLGDCFLRLSLPERGRVAIRKANSPGGPWPVVLMSPVNTDFEIRIYGETAGKFIRIETTAMPSSCELIPI